MIGQLLPFLKLVEIYVNAYYTYNEYDVRVISDEIILGQKFNLVTYFVIALKDE